MTATRRLSTRTVLLSAGACLLAIVPLAVSASPGNLFERPAAPQRTITVCPTSCEHASIGAALGAAQAGDTVSVGNGTYVERVTVPPSVELRGAGPQTVIDGGGEGTVVRIDGTASGPDTVVSGLTVRGGRAAQGGGIAVTGGAAPTLSGLVVQGNAGIDAQSRGGGLYLGGGSTASVQASAFYSNTSGSGAAIYVDGADATLSGLVVGLNRAELNGGGVVLNASRGRLEASSFTANVAAGSGGAVFVQSGSPVLENLVVAGYNASFSGGGLSIVGGTAALRHSRVISNTAGAVGGGLSVSGSAQPELFNNIIAENLAVAAGAGIAFDEGADGSIRYNTISGNQGLQGGNGDGLYLFGAGTNPRIEGNIIVGNTYGIRGPTVGGGRVPNPVIVANDVWNNGRGDLVGLNIENQAATSGNLSLDPLFTGARDAGYYLAQTAAGGTVTSPAVDAGAESAAAAGLSSRTTRLDYAPDAGAADLGFHYAVPVAPTATPTEPATAQSPTATVTPAASPTPRRGRASVQPSDAVTDVGEDVVLSIEVDTLGESTLLRAPLAPLYQPVRTITGYRAIVGFDPAIVRFVDFQTGPLAARPGARVTELSPVLTAGRASIGADVVPGADEPLERGTLARITFAGLDDGVSPVALEAVELHFGPGVVRTLEPSDGRIYVGDFLPPTPSIYLPAAYYLP